MVIPFRQAHTHTIDQKMIYNIGKKETRITPMENQDSHYFEVKLNIGRSDSDSL